MDLRAPKSKAERFCPYHGGYIHLADCPIVATNLLYNARNGAAAPPPAGGGGRAAASGFAANVGANQNDDEPPTHTPPVHTPAPGRKAFVSMVAETVRVGTLLLSRVDGEQRVVLAKAPGRNPKGIPGRSLKSPAELALKAGGPTTRPARACPHCCHPLPATLDYRDAFPVVLVGHRSSSKTSTALAIIEEAGNCDPKELGASSFVPTEATTRYLQRIDKDIFINFRRGKGPSMTGREHHPPLEFVTTLGVGGTPISILLHDVAGEDLTDPDTRVQRAPSVLWADAIIFLYNPEDSPRMDLTGRQDQAAVLNGLRDDIEARGQFDASRNRYKDPPLLLVVSKADLVVPVDLLETDGIGEAEDVQKALRWLRDGAVINAAKRFPRVSWHFIAPIPPDGSGPLGVISLFRTLLEELRK